LFELWEANIPQESKAHWKKHSVVSGVVYDSLSATIYVHFIPPLKNLTHSVSFAQLLYWIDEELVSELSSVGSVFREYKIPLFQVRLKNNNSGEILDLFRPPQHDTCFLIRIRNDAVNLALISRVQEILKRNTGNHKVAIELIMGSGARVYVDALWMTASPTERAITALKNTLGEALVDCEVRTPGPKGGQVIFR
jgi:hypothetical protein